MSSDISNMDQPAASVGDVQPDIADDIRKQVETEQALADARSKLKDLESELEKVKREKEALQSEKDGVGELCLSRIFANF